MKDLPSNEQPREVVTDKLCPYCLKEPQLVDSAVVYGRSYGKMLLCKPCDAYVGCHKRSKKHHALGRLANKELRQWKMKAHTKFDSMWRMSTRKNARSNAYAWLGEQMKLKPSRTHIGMFNVDQCRTVIELCDTLLRSVSRSKR